MGRGIFWVGEGGRTFFMGGWEWVDIFYGWVGVGGGGWKDIFGGWRWLKIFYG